MKHAVTFIVGGSFRVVDGQVLVQRRSWEMLRIFSDQLSQPVFGMLCDQRDETLSYPLPPSVQIVSLPLVRGRVKLLNSLRNHALSPNVRKTVDGSHVVYLRQPLWECWDIYRYARSRQKRILTSFHGDWPDALKKAEAGGVRRLLNHALAGYVHHQYSAMARQSDLVFCVGEAIQRKYGCLNKTSVVFANFLHRADDIAPARALNERPPFNVLFVGQFEEYKGVKYLVRALGILNREGVKCRLLLVGRGGLEAAIRVEAEQEGIADLVEWYGYIQHGKQLLELYREADVFVLPSIASEGTAKVLMEAMSQGVPVVATDVGSTRMLLGDGRYGCVVPPADPLSLSRSIQGLIADVKRRHELVDRGFELARMSTKDRQEEIVRKAIASTIPEVLGTPGYLADLDSVDGNVEESA